MLASDITGKRERHLVEKILWPVVVFDFDAVIRVIAHAARYPQCLFAKRILISKHREPTIGTVQDLHSEPGPMIESSVGLPAVGEPRLDLQMLSRKNLDAHAVEEP